jgi:hypothetical protein
MKNKIFATPAAIKDIPVKPKTAARIATNRNINAQYNIQDSFRPRSTGSTFVAISNALCIQSDIAVRSRADEKNAAYRCTYHRRFSESQQTSLPGLLVMETRHIRLGDVLIYWCVFGLAASSIVKFLHPAKVLDYMGYLGYANGTFFLIAGLELLTAVLLFFQPTRAAGLLLVSSYFGGAISAHLANHPFSAGGLFLAFNANHHFLGTPPATTFLVSAWIGVWLRHPESRWSFRATS